MTSKSLSSRPAVANQHAIPVSAWIALLVGVLAVSTSAVIIKQAQNEGVPSLVIAAFRLTLATLVLTPLTLTRHRDALRALTRRDWMLLATSGVFLALHFATWISSLEYTSVLISTVLVTTTPLWVSALEVIFLRARLNRWVILGIIECLVGGIAIGLTGTEGGIANNPVLGGTLALIGAMTVAVYMVIGRSVRARLALLPYIWVVYGCAALTMLVITSLRGLSFTGYSNDAYLYLVLAALIPQVLGHSSFNFAVKYLPATYIGIVTQLEPIASSGIAFFLLNEQPTITQVIASALILFGVANVVLSPSPVSAEESVQEAEAH